MHHPAKGYEKFIAHEGDLAISLTGSLGYVAKVTEDCLVNQRVLVIKKDDADLLSILHPFIKNDDFKNYCFAKSTSDSNKNIT